MPTAVASIVTWIVDSTVGVTVVLLLGRALLHFVKNPAARQRLGEWTLAGCLLVAGLGLVPGMPRLSLGLLDPIAERGFNSQLNAPATDIGIVHSAAAGCGIGSTDKENGRPSTVVAGGRRLARIVAALADAGLVVGGAGVRVCGRRFVDAGAACSGPSAAAASGA